MGALTDLLANFGYYAQLMIQLAVIAESHVGAIPAQVDSLGWNVVWGPAELRDGLGVSYSRAFIARRADSAQYTVVIRGTNPLSWRSWMGEDFAIGRTVPFNALWPTDTLPAALVNAGRISQATYNGMTDLLELRDPRGLTIPEFLQGESIGSLYVTGHSLGGTLTPVMFAYLNQVLYDGAATNMAPFSFAGLTPGDSAFNRYLGTMIDPALPWRIYNTLDITPRMWASYYELENIYVPHGLRWGALDAALITTWFDRAQGLGYAQPAGGCALEGVFRHGFLNMDGGDWTNQAIHQHHGRTYKRLVFATFPEDDTPATACGTRPTIAFRGIRPMYAEPAVR
jgi:hypothetical protein